MSPVSVPIFVLFVSHHCLLPTCSSSHPGPHSYQALLGEFFATCWVGYAHVLGLGERPLFPSVPVSCCSLAVVKEGGRGGSTL